MGLVCCQQDEDRPRRWLKGYLVRRGDSGGTQYHRRTDLNLS